MCCFSRESIGAGGKHLPTAGENRGARIPSATAEGAAVFRQAEAAAREAETVALAGLSKPRSARSRGPAQAAWGPA
jgi:hypothetical protein